MACDIAVIVGSLRKESYNRKLATAVAKLAPPRFAFNQIAIGELPLYNQDYEKEPSAAIEQFRSEIRSAQGIIFVTPEYNRSIPGVLKNAIDHASRPYGQSAWRGKPAAILGISVGITGTAMAQQHLRNILAYLDMPTLGQPEMFIQVTQGLFDGAAEIGPASRDFFQTWMNAFVAWVDKHAPLGAEK